LAPEPSPRSNRSDSGRSSARSTIDWSSALLVIEVSDSSLRADRAKAAVYASAGIGEYWLVNLGARTVEIHSSPEGDRYAEVRTARTSDVLRPAALPDVTLAVDASPAGSASLEGACKWAEWLCRGARTGALWADRAWIFGRRPTTGDFVAWNATEGRVERGFSPRNGRSYPLVGPALEGAASSEDASHRIVQEQRIHGAARVLGTECEPVMGVAGQHSTISY
jgi:hypothetical protein